MNKKTTLFIIITISVAITGLLVMEGVFINMLLLKEKQRFEYVINTVFSNSVQQLYQMEINTDYADDMDEIYIQYGGILDSLIGDALVKMKINLEYDCGIYDLADGQMLYHKGTGDVEYLINSEYFYIINLHDDDICGSRSAYSIMLYFPHAYKYVLKRLNIVLISIFVLILLIVCVFVWAIVLAYQQEQLSKMKRSLMLNIAHELKTPITTIKLACEALKDKSLKLSEKQIQDQLSIILDEDKRMHSMVEQMLHYTKLNVSEFKLDFKPINIEDIINAAIDCMKIQIRAQKATVTTEFNASNPYILGDKINLHNVFTNLIDNSLKYNDKDCQIKISTENKYNSIVICVEDNGIGVTKSQQKRIFDQFYRAPSGSAFNSKGFGLGLNYVKIIIEKHSGTISIKSKPQQWTQFIIKIPNCKKNNNHE